MSLCRLQEFFRGSPQVIGFRKIHNKDDREKPGNSRDDRFWLDAYLTVVKPFWGCECRQVGFILDFNKLCDVSTDSRTIEQLD